MSTTNTEPQQLLARLERKFVRKVQAVESRRRVRHLRASLSQIDGSNVRQLGDEIYALNQFDYN